MQTHHAISKLPLADGAGHTLENVALRLQLGHFATETIDLQLLGPHLAVPRECVSRIGGKLLHPFAQHVLVHIQIASRLRNCDTALAN
jgi:hypothetical protein